MWNVLYCLQFAGGPEMKFVLAAVVLGINTVSQGAVPETINVYLSITSSTASESSRDLVSSYVRSELRALGDVRFTERAEANSGFHIKVAESTHGPSRILDGYALSAVVCSRGGVLIYHTLWYLPMTDLRTR